MSVNSDFSDSFDIFDDSDYSKNVFDSVELCDSSILNPYTMDKHFNHFQNIYIQANVKPNCVNKVTKICLITVLNIYFFSLLYRSKVYLCYIGRYNQKSLTI